MRRDPFVIGIAATLVVLGAATAFTFMVGGVEPPAGSKPVTRSELAAAVGELSTFIEEERGLQVPSDVEVEVLDQEELSEEFLGGEDFSASLFDSDTLVALGLVDASVDLDDLLDDAATLGLAGFYDPVDNAAFVLGAPGLTLFARVSLIHELTHAGQAETPVEFDLRTDTEGFAAIQALVEGDATWVTNRYVAQLGDDDRHRYEDGLDEFVADIDASIDGGADVEEAFELFARLGEFPYVQGEVFVSALVDDGGTEAIDDAFDDPPITTEHILHPDRYLDEDRPQPVDEPDVAGDTLEDGVLGELFVLEILAGRGLPEGTAQAAAEGWGGDAYVTWQDGADLRATAHIEMDTEADAVELEDALRGSTDSGDAALASVERSGTRLTVEFVAAGAA